MRKRFRKYYKKEYRTLTLLVGTIKNDDGTYTLVLPHLFLKSDFKSRIITADEYNVLSRTVYSILKLHIEKYKNFHCDEIPLATHADNIVSCAYNGQPIKWEYISLNIIFDCNDRLPDILYNKCLDARKAYIARNNARVKLKNTHKVYVNYCEDGTTYNYFVSKNNLDEAVRRRAKLDKDIKNILSDIQEYTMIIQDAREYTKKHYSRDKGKFYYYLYLAGKLNESN